ncbi:hypothetical protein [Bacillus sp. AFS002410]|uniref:hypothetical protein n=1 Tax=Bacillus sp. AFS002410 TaxID=2033481 RepID=UPI0015CF7BBE|nr:hypothetical protein [Bacillus sp. AFS002410]
MVQFPIGKASMADGTNKTFTITPKKGNKIDTIKVDGVNVKFTGNTYTLTNITKNRTIM